MKIEMKDIILMIVGAVIGFMIIYLATSNLPSGCLGIIPGVGGGALGSFIARKMKSKKSD